MADQPNFSDGLSSLISFTGINVPARARFVAQCIGSSLYSSLTIGLVCGQVGALTSAGPLIPFMAGGWVGYTWGCFGFWRQSRIKTMNCARRYPKLLAHALLINFDVEVPDNVNLEATDNHPKSEIEVSKSSNNSLEEWIKSGGVGRLSFAMLATQSCDEEILEMQKSERQRLVDQYTEAKA